MTASRCETIRSDSHIALAAYHYFALTRDFQYSDFRVRRSITEVSASRDLLRK